MYQGVAYKRSMAAYKKPFRLILGLASEVEKATTVAGIGELGAAEAEVQGVNDKSTYLFILYNSPRLSTRQQ